MLSGGVLPMAEKLSPAPRIPRSVCQADCHWRVLLGRKLEHERGSPWASTPLRMKPKRDQKRSRRSSEQLSSANFAPFRGPS